MSPKIFLKIRLSHLAIYEKPVVHCPFRILTSPVIYYFAKSSIFAKYIGHRGLSVWLSVCLSSKALQATRMVRSSWYFDRRCLDTGQCTMQKVFFKGEGQGQGHHFCENQIMGHNFWTGSDRDFWLVGYDLTSRDFIENHIMGHNLTVKVKAQTQ